MTKPQHPIAENIRRQRLSIYDHVRVGDPNLWFSNSELEKVLSSEMIGFVVPDVPIRTRSKIVKTEICRILGYEAPSTFKKTKPRFPGQNFDSYSQVSGNLQIWNDEIEPGRRYVIIRISSKNIVDSVRIILGIDLAKLDTTGTLTHKFQARLIPSDQVFELVSRFDTAPVTANVSKQPHPTRFTCVPTLSPQSGQILPINEVFSRLSSLVGSKFPDAGANQERNRGSALHRLVCQGLGYGQYQDSGQFPDVVHQLLEVKLQTSPTIDLGLVEPASTEETEYEVSGIRLRHCDVRYAIFYGNTDGSNVSILKFFLATGSDFFSRFPRFEGKVKNKKLQIPLPKNFFSR